jgi:3,4-dihydroxy 2-butanone 4-phosphate synthase/GTP cyclohydrolase II
MPSIAPPSSSVARQPALFLKGCSVSKDAKGSLCTFLNANSNNAKGKSLGLRIASSSKKDGASSISGNGEMRLPKSATGRGQDHPVADVVSPMGDSVVAPEILSANLARVADKFSYGDADTELDLDSPTEGFASIADAIEDIRQGKFVIVVDDESRENEGDLIMPASLVTPEAMAFIVRHGTGIVCASMKEDDLERLNLPLMVNAKENEEKLCTAFTVTVVWHWHHQYERISFFRLPQVFRCSIVVFTFCCLSSY